MGVRKQFCVNGHDTNVVGRRPENYSCRACANERRKKYYYENNGREKARLKARVIDLKKYGLTQADVEAMLVRQQGKCLGCRAQLLEGERRGERFHIDHNHNTGVVRGLLCHGCNTALGLVGEQKSTLRRLMSYLDYDRGKIYAYVIGSLRNPKVTEVAAQLRQAGLEAIDDWMAAGPEADSYWQQYEIQRGHTFAEALHGKAAENVFNFDRSWIDLADCGVLVMPSGRSGHLELGYMAGQGKQTFILQTEDPERYDVMPQFATKVVGSVDELVKELSCESASISTAA